MEDKVDTKNGIKDDIPHMKFIRICCCFYVGVGCRFGDMVKMKVSNLEFDDSTPKPKKGESYEGGRKGICRFQYGEK